MNVLAISPHTDDIELGAGGYLARLVEEGATVYTAAFGTGDPFGGAVRGEFGTAMDLLGIERERVRCLSFESRRLPDRRQAVLDRLLALGAWANPDLVFVPSTYDTHQDHATVTAEAIRAFRTTSLLGYELPWSNGLGFVGHYYVELSQGHLEKKLMAIEAYVSQQSRHYTGDLARHVATMRGAQIKAQYAECFEVIKWIV